MVVAASPRLLGDRPHHRGMEEDMKRKEPPPTIEVDTLDQEMLVHIRNELQTHTRILRAMNKTVQLIGLIILLTVVLGCIAVILGGPSLLF